MSQLAWFSERAIFVDPTQDLRADRNVPKKTEGSPWLAEANRRQDVAGEAEKGVLGCSNFLFLRPLQRQSILLGKELTIRPRIALPTTVGSKHSLEYILF